MKWQWEKACLRTISDEIPGESVYCEPRADLRRTKRKQNRSALLANCVLAGNNKLSTSNSCDSLYDIVLVPKCCPSWIRREKYICIKTKNISASPVPAWQKDSSSRCTYAAGTGLAEKTLNFSVLAVFILTQQETVKNSLYYTSLLRQVKEDLQNLLWCLFTRAAVHAVFFLAFTSQEAIWRHNLQHGVRYKIKHQMSPKDLIFNSAAKVGSDLYCNVENETAEIFLVCQVKHCQLYCYHTVNKPSHVTEAVHI